MPDGTKKHDEFLGEVEVYHKTLDATLPYTLADARAKTVAVTITVQGCHEVDPKICYPPNPTQLTLDVPASAAKPASAASAQSGSAALSLGSKLGTVGATDAEPLPPEQAFVFEAIAASPTSILARWTMPKNYYPLPRQEQGHARERRRRRARQARLAEGRRSHGRAFRFGRRLFRSGRIADSADARKRGARRSRSTPNTRDARRTASAIR